jgi:uncharacterized membrane protein YvbJ
MPYCANCEAKLEGEESFCPFCGEMIKSRVKKSQSSTDSQVEALRNEVSSLRQQLQNQKTQGTEHQKSQEPGCLICCLVVFFFLMLIVTVNFFSPTI